MSTDVAELPDNATQEDIGEFVDKVVEDEGKKDAPPDSQQIADDHAQGEPSEEVPQKTDEQTPAGDETPAGKDAAVESDKEATGEDQGQEEEESRDWLDDDLKAEIAALGIDEEHLADFTSREELDRALRLLDHGAMEAGRKALSKADEGKKLAEHEEEPKKPAPKADDEGYKVGLDPETYDEEVVKEFSKLHDHLETRLEARFARLEAAEQQRVADAVESQFDAIVDSLDHTDLFGKAGKESKTQLENRQKLFDSQEVYQAGLRSLGREGRLDKALVTRVLQMEFADHLSKQQRKALTRKITGQSESRQGVGSIKAEDQDGGEPIEDWVAREIKRRGG